MYQNYFNLEIYEQLSDINKLNYLKNRIEYLSNFIRQLKKNYKKEINELNIYISKIKQNNILTDNELKSYFIIERKIIYSEIECGFIKKIKNLSDKQINEINQIIESFHSKLNALENNKFYMDFKHRADELKNLKNFILEDKNFIFEINKFIYQIRDKIPFLKRKIAPKYIENTNGDMYVKDILNSFKQIQLSIEYLDSKNKDFSYNKICKIFKKWVKLDNIEKKFHTGLFLIRNNDLYSMGDLIEETLLLQMNINMELERDKMNYKQLWLTLF